MLNIDQTNGRYTNYENKLNKETLQYKKNKSEPQIIHFSDTAEPSYGHLVFSSQRSAHTFTYNQTPLMQPLHEYDQRHILKSQPV